MEAMWRQLLEYTDTVGRAMVGTAGVLLVIAVASFVVGVVRASTGLAATTLPFWLVTMGSAIIAGVLVYLAGRRGDFRRR
jgi:predicted membrane-bound dolichyl-phosphate-mannose-protein mannosyltransferase